MEMCASVTDSPPVRVGVVAVNNPATSWCLMNEVRPMMNSRKPLMVPTRSSADKCFTATRLGLNSSMMSFKAIR